MDFDHDQPNGFDLLRRVNAYQLPVDLMLEAMQSIAALPRDDAGMWDPRAMAVAGAVLSEGLSGDEAETAATAVHFRLHAISMVLRDGGGRGFRFATAEAGKEYLDPIFVQCAVEEPLIVADGPVRYDADSFNRRLLSIARPAGQA